MVRGQYQPDLIIKHWRIVQTAARQNIRGHHQIQLALLKRWLRIERHAGFEIHLHLRPFRTEILKRRGQPLNAAMTFNGDP